MAEKWLTIGELSEATGTKAVTIRYFERIGLFPAPPRGKNQYRAYGGKHVRIIKAIVFLKNVGVNKEDLVRIAKDISSGRKDCSIISSVLKIRVEELGGEIDLLVKQRAFICEQLSKCCNSSYDNCRILDAL